MATTEKKPDSSNTTTKPSKARRQRKKTAKPEESQDVTPEAEIATVVDDNPTPTDADHTAPPEPYDWETTPQADQEAPVQELPTGVYLPSPQPNDTENQPDNLPDLAVNEPSDEPANLSAAEENPEGQDAGEPALQHETENTKPAETDAAVGEQQPDNPPQDGNQAQETSVTAFDKTGEESNANSGEEEQINEPEADAEPAVGNHEPETMPEPAVGNQEPEAEPEPDAEESQEPDIELEPNANDIQLQPAPSEPAPAPDPVHDEQPPEPVPGNQESDANTDAPGTALGQLETSELQQDEATTLEDEPTHQSAEADDEEDQEEISSEDEEDAQETDEEPLDLSKLKITLRSESPCWIITVGAPGADPQVEWVETDSIETALSAVTPIIDRAKARWETTPRFPQRVQPATTPKPKKTNRQMPTAAQPAGAQPTASQPQPASSQATMPKLF